MDDDPRMQFDLLATEQHRPLAGDHVIKFVGPFVVVQLGISNLNAVDLAGRTVLLLNEAADLAAGLLPGLDFRWVTTQESGCGAHGGLLPRKKPRAAGLDLPKASGPDLQFSPSYWLVGIVKQSNTVTFRGVKLAFPFDLT
jgi:hypothetical protein